MTKEIETFRGIRTWRRWLILKLAERENAWAHFCLGVSYDNSDGVEQDYEQAVRWYRLAAERGLEDAKYQLAVLENSKGPQQPVGKIINFLDIHKKNKTRTRDRPIEGTEGETLSNSTNVLTE